MKIIKIFSFTYYFFIIFISLNTIKKISCVEINILDPALYKNEICSYNGDAEIDNSTVTCTCYDSYVDEPRKKLIKYINGQKVQCSYHKKKRFTAFFWAAILPLGFDYYYLGHYGYFALVFICVILICASQLVCFLLSYRLNEWYEESKYKFNSRKNTRIFGFIQNNKKPDSKEKIRKCVEVYKIINKILGVLILFYWITDICLQAKGIIKDKNGVETENDMNALFSKEET